MGRQVQRHIRGFLQAIATGGGKPIEQMTPREAPAVLEGLQSRIKVDLPPADVAERIISTERQTVKVVVVRPAGVTGRPPVFMFFHGGGWVLGDFPTHERLVRDLVAGSGASAVFVEYDRSPEARYPVAINQAYAATSWVAAHGDEIGVDGGRLAVAGNGAGGNMAAVVALMAKDRGRPNIRCQLLLWPATNAAFDTASYDEFAEGYFLTRNMMKWFWYSYPTDPRERQDVYASPLQAAPELLRGPAAGDRPGGRDGCLARRRRGVCAPAGPGRRGRDGHALQRPHSRLRAAQPAESGSWSPFGPAPRGGPTEGAPVVNPTRRDLRRDDRGKEIRHGCALP